MGTMTKREFLTAVVASDISTEVREFAQEQLLKLDERNAKRKTRGTKVQQANAGIMSAILTAMQRNVTYTASTIAEMGIEGITSTQKASSLLRQLVSEGSVIETEVPIKVAGRGTRKVKGYTLAPETDVGDDDVVYEIEVEEEE